MSHLEEPTVSDSNAETVPQQNTEQTTPTEATTPETTSTEATPTETSTPETTPTEATPTEATPTETSTPETTPTETTPTETTAAETATPVATTSENTTDDKSDDNVSTDCDIGSSDIQDLADEFEKHMSSVHETHSKFLERINKLKQQMGDHDCCKKVQRAEEADESKKELAEKKISDILEKLQAAREAAEALLS